MTTHTATPLTAGATYLVTYYTAPGHTTKTATKTLTLTTILVTGVAGKVTYIFHGPKGGGKIVLAPAVIVAAVPA